MGGYQLLGDLHITLPGHGNPARYQRDLDIGNSLAHVTYQTGGVTYRREYFASHPDQVLVERLTADKPGVYTGSIELSRRPRAASPRRRAARSCLPANSPMACSTRRRFRSSPMAAHVTAEGGKLNFSHCNSLTLIVGAGTSYVMDYRRRYQGDDPHTRRVRGRFRPRPPNLMRR